MLWSIGIATSREGNVGTSYWQDDLSMSMPLERVCGIDERGTLTDGTCQQMV